MRFMVWLWVWVARVLGGAGYSEPHPSTPKAVSTARYVEGEVISIHHGRGHRARGRR